MSFNQIEKIKEDDNLKKIEIIYVTGVMDDKDILKSGKRIITFDELIAEIKKDLS